MPRVQATRRAILPPGGRKRGNFECYSESRYITVTGHVLNRSEGVSKRRVDDLVKSLGCEGISKSQASRICRELDATVESFLGRRGSSSDGK